MKITKEQIEGFRIYLTQSERSDATVEKYMRDLFAFSAWLGGREVTKSEVLEYKKHLTESYCA